MASALQCELARGEVLAVTSRARIHCALLNTSGLFGRVDGGIGFSVENPRWEIEVGFGISPESSKLPAELLTAVQNALSKLQSIWNVPALGIRVRSAIGAHTGLGSKTALLLAVGRAASILSGRRISAVSIAQVLGRGGTSGIGVHCFRHGGLVWDAGHAFAEKRCFAPSSASAAPPPSAIVQLPVKWLSVVHFRFSRSGMHGEEERRIFAEQCPTADSGTVTALVAVSSLILPGLVERRENLLQHGLSTTGS